MQTADTGESKAIRNLISQIDEIDQWRDRVGRRLIGLFVGVFVVAVGMLVLVVTYGHPPQNLKHPGPRVPGVLKNWKEQTKVSPSTSSTLR